MIPSIPIPLRVALVALSLSVFAISVRAATKTITLAVPTMDCPVCPITVKKALTQVPGVSQASVRFDTRQAVVTFDDTRTSAQALTLATRDAGFPSTMVGGGP